MTARARQGVLPLQRPVVDSRPEERNGHHIGGFLSRHALCRGEAGQYAAVLGLLLYVVSRPEFFLSCAGERCTASFIILRLGVVTRPALIASALSRPGDCSAGSAALRGILLSTSPTASYVPSIRS